MWYLILLMIIFVLLVIVVFVVKPWHDAFSDMAIFTLLVTFACGIALIIALGTIPVYRANVHNQLARRDALQQTYNELRANPLEMASVGKEIAMWNGWLASAKYWNGTQWHWWWPDDVKQAKPIR